MLSFICYEIVNRKIERNKWGDASVVVGTNWSADFKLIGVGLKVKVIWTSPGPFLVLSTILHHENIFDLRKKNTIIA